MLRPLPVPSRRLVGINWWFGHVDRRIDWSLAHAINSGIAARDWLEDRLEGR
ncbi:MAG: hypothetical protein OEM67_11150 [Thermoleophilia bacterium]|nr:hypothetical protein [Thermoleophilia bacterium]